jgi:hypothetical protein
MQCNDYIYIYILLKSQEGDPSRTFTVQFSSIEVQNNKIKGWKRYTIWRYKSKVDFKTGLSRFQSSKIKNTLF